MGSGILMFDEEVFNRIGGWFTVEEARCLYHRAIEVEALIVELGSWQGKSTYALACAVRDSHKPPVIAVDRFTGSTEHRPGGTQPIWTFPQYWQNLTDAKVIPDHVITIIGDTVQTARLFASEAVGFLLHDASHEPEFVAADFKAWLPKVRKDGLIWVHDLTVGAVHRAAADAGFTLTVAETIRPASNCFKFLK